MVRERPAAGIVAAVALVRLEAVDTEPGQIPLEIREDPACLLQREVRHQPAEGRVVAAQGLKLVIDRAGRVNVAMSLS